MFASGKKDKEFKVVAKSGAAVAPFAYLCENNPKLGKNIQFYFSVCNEYEEVLSALIQGDAPIGVLPVEAAAKVFAQVSTSIVALGVCGNGDLYVASKNSALTSLSHLKGKTVAGVSQGTAADYAVRYLLKKAGVPVGENDDSVHLDYSVAPADMTAALQKGTVQYAIMQEPYMTVAEIKGNDISRSIDFQKEYASFEDGASFPVFLLVANANFMVENKDLVQAFVNAYKKATDWTNAKPAQAAALVQKHNLGMIAPVVVRSIPYASYVWVDAKSAASDIERVLKICLDANADSIGGKLPDETFYYVF
ncbi:MAG: ABC transporter substrate-binding protein [Treponema sp.]|nr:ABC transporter substrate-binding protein [Treponema sp.]